MALTSTITLSAVLRQTSSIDLGSLSYAVNYGKTHSLPSGTANGQADLLFSDTRTILASANADLDLAGVLEDAFGAVITMVEVVAIIIVAATGNTNNVVVKPAASNGFLGPFGDPSDTISIKPGGMFVITAPAAGWAVAAGTGDLLNLANSGAGSSVVFDIFVLGRSS